ncbi:hypothetical protein, partial [Chengkuizengella marina]
MVVFKKNTLFHFMIGLMLLVVLILFSMFSSTEVHAQEREGYKMIDQGTYKVYVPEEEIVENESNLNSSNLKSIDPKSTNLKSTNLSNSVG